MAIQPSRELILAIQHYKNGRQEAFDTIYHSSLPYITKCVLTVINRTAPDADDDLLQDILQDTYITIAEKLNTLQKEDAFFQWAGQIATNYALRTWNKIARQQAMETSEDDLVYEVADEAFIPEDILENKEKQLLIRKMLQELPTPQYLCLVEYFYNGLKEKEIAQKLEMPLGTVKTNLSRAKKKLKQIVQTHEKKHGVKLYSMSWLLLPLFWQDVAEVFIDTNTASATLAAVTAKTAAGTAGTATAAGTAGVAGIATKIVAGVVAAALLIGGAGVAIHQTAKNRPSQDTTTHTTQSTSGAGQSEQYEVDWDALPFLAPRQIAVLESAIGSITSDNYPEIIAEADTAVSQKGQIANAECKVEGQLILTGINAESQYLELVLELHPDHCRVLSVEASENHFFPINNAMREQGFLAVPWTPHRVGVCLDIWLSDAAGQFYVEHFWKQKLGHNNFTLFYQSDNSQTALLCCDPESYEASYDPVTGSHDMDNVICYGWVWIDNATLDVQWTYRPGGMLYSDGIEENVQSMSWRTFLCAEETPAVVDKESIVP